jgi:hypothetical protein
VRRASPARPAIGTGSGTTISMSSSARIRAYGEPEEGCRQGLWAGSGKWRALGSLRDALLCFEASGFAW